MSRSVAIHTPQRSQPVQLPAHPGSHARAQSHSGASVGYPAGGVLASMRAAAAMPVPPRTPQPGHAAAAYGSYGGAAIAAHAAVPPSSSAMHTPLRPSASTPSFASPAPVPPVSVTAPPLHPATPTAAAPSPGGVSGLSEAESTKLQAALQHFVLVALQQQSAAANAAAANASSRGGGVAVPDVKNYATLLSQLSAAHSDPLALSRWLQALSHCVSSLHAQHHSKLLSLLYAFDYAGAQSTRNVEALTHLLVAICVGGSVQAVDSAMRTLVKTFIATNVPFSTLSAASVSPALYGRPGDASLLPQMQLGPGSVAGSELSVPGASSAGAAPPSMDTIHDLVHLALSRLVSLLPSSPSVLFPLLVELFPHKRLDEAIQLVYVKNLLRVSEYAPSIRDRILTAICERMMHIDVEIGPEGDEEDEEDEDDSDEDGAEGSSDDGAADLPGREPELMFAMSTGGTIVTSLSPQLKPSASSSVARAATKAQKPLSESRLMANKLDALMALMFEYLNLVRLAAVAEAKTAGAGGGASSAAGKSLAPSVPHTPGGLITHAPITPTAASSSGNDAPISSSVASTPGELCDEIFSSLLRVFERSVLRTHNSRFLQFLLFYYCSFKHAYAEAFLKYLLEKGFESHVSGVERQNAALYIASFVARSAYLRHSSAIVAFEMLLKWTHAYTAYHMETSRAALAASMSNAYSRHAPAASSALQVAEVGPLEAGQHAVFYRLCTALLYIFCYRQDSFRSMREQQPEVLARLRLDELLESPLNPLRFVSAGVTEEFARVNRQLGGIVAVDAIVARNQRLNAASMMGQGATGTKGAGRGGALNPRTQGGGSSNGVSTSGGIGGGGGGADGGQSGGGGASSASAPRFDPEDIFFPFDPYQLKDSNRFVEPIYRHYRSAGDDEEDDDDDEDDAQRRVKVESGESSESDVDDEDGGERMRRDGSSFSSSSSDEEEHVSSSATAAQPIRIGGPASVRSSAGGGGTGQAAARTSRKRKLRLGTSTASPAFDAASLRTMSPDLEGGLSSMSASFSEQLSLAASPAILGAAGPSGAGGVAMSFEMDRGAQFLPLPPAAGGVSSGSMAIKGRSSAARGSDRSVRRSANQLSRSLRMEEQKTNGGGLGQRKARKQTHKPAAPASSSDDDEGQRSGAGLNAADFSFTDSPPWEKTL